MRKISAHLRAFGRREDGTIMVEGVIVLPMLLWAMFAMFVFWDAHRSINTIQKASYTVSDMISRRLDPINGTYVTGLRDVMNFLLEDDQTAKIRVSSVIWMEDNNRFEILWSYSPGNTKTPLTTSTLQPFADKIPMMSDGDTVVVVETEVGYTPAFDVGLGEQTVKQFIVTRPRLGNCVIFTGMSNTSCLPS